MTDSPIRDKEVNHNYKSVKYNKLKLLKKQTSILDSGAPRFRPHKMEKKVVTFD